jgi:hypothetical protein
MSICSNGHLFEMLKCRTDTFLTRPIVKHSTKFKTVNFINILQFEHIFSSLTPPNLAVLFSDKHPLRGIFMYHFEPHVGAMSEYRTTECQTLECRIQHKRLNAERRNAKRLEYQILQYRNPECRIWLNAECFECRIPKKKF